MSHPKLEYRFHDSCLRDILIGPRREVTLTIDLYPIDYPEKPTVRVRFGGIFDFEKVEAFFSNLYEAEQNGYLDRIDALDYVPEKRSRDGDLHLFVRFDRAGSLRIHCRHLSIDQKPS